MTAVILSSLPVFTRHRLDAFIFSPSEDRLTAFLTSYRTAMSHIGADEDEINGGARVLEETLRAFYLSDVKSG